MSGGADPGHPKGEPRSAATTAATAADQATGQADASAAAPGLPWPEVEVASPAASRADPWLALRRHTPARIALGRSGSGLPTHELLRLAAAHAQARDAVHVPLDTAALAAALHSEGWTTLQVTSRAASRDDYLRRPDWGRRLAEASARQLTDWAATQTAATGPDLAIVLGDGLSALALQRHARPVLAALREALAEPPALTPPWRVAPLVLATQARVALGDEVGALLHAKLVLVLLGERPGLSAADSLGAYLTHAPRVGCTDAQRNCVSNIRPEGLPPSQAATRLAWLVREALRRRLTGVALKDDSATGLLAG